MPDVIVSGNLNTWGNAGNFETDPSTWGFSGIRTSEQKSKNLYSLKYTASGAWDGVIVNGSRIAFANFTPEAGKKYVIKAKVWSKVGQKPATNASYFKLFPDGQTITSFISKTVLESEGAWVDIESKWTHDSGAIGGFGYFVYLTGNVFGGDNLIEDGVCYVDELEIYEYIITEGEEEPPPTEEPEATINAYLSKNPITHSLAASGGWELLTNPRLYCDIRVEDVADSGTYTSKLKVDLTPDVDGNVVFYLNEAFGDCFTFNAPTLNQATIARLTDRIKRFKNFTGSLTGTEITPGALTETGPHVVLWGGIDKFQWPTLNYLTAYVAANMKFLTWAPIQKEVDRVQEDYLNFWIYDASIIGLQLRCKVYFDDATDETDIVASIETVQYRGLYQLPAGPANCGALLVNPAKTAIKYELTLLDQDDVVVSETRTYIINQVSHPLARYFMFLNSLGAFEVLRFTGQQATKSTYVRDVVQKFLAHNYSASDGEFAQNGITRIEQKSIGSGFVKSVLAQEWHDYLKDFIGSPVIYDVTDGTRFPVVVTGGEHNTEDQNYERFIRIEARDAYNNESYTPANV